MMWFNAEFEIVPRKQYFEYCRFPRGWDWKLLYKIYRYEPKPCWEDGVSWPALSDLTFHPGSEAEDAEAK